MESVILVIHLIVALGIVALVLVQPSESGGFLGSSGTMSNLMAPRRTSDPLTRMTSVFVTIFFITSLVLAIMAEHRAPQKSLLDAAPAATPAAPDEGALKKVEEKKPEPVKEKKKKPAAPISQ